MGPLAQGRDDRDHGRAAAARLDAGRRAPRALRRAPGRWVAEPAWPSPRSLCAAAAWGGRAGAAGETDAASAAAPGRSGTASTAGTWCRMAVQPTSRPISATKTPDRSASPRRRSPAAGNARAAGARCSSWRRAAGGARRRAPVRRRARRLVAADQPRCAQSHSSRLTRAPGTGARGGEDRGPRRARRTRTGGARGSPAARRRRLELLALGVARRPRRWS